MSYRPEVIADSTGTWSSNGLRFATEAEAKAYVKDLEWRWTSVRDTRIVESSDPVSHVWISGPVGCVRPVGEQL